jgi:hypothetical protein
MHGKSQIESKESHLCLEVPVRIVETDEKGRLQVAKMDFCGSRALGWPG